MLLPKSVSVWLTLTIPKLSFSGYLLLAVHHRAQRSLNASLCPPVSSARSEGSTGVLFPNFSSEKFNLMHHLI